jgi:HD-GYP domain-containing protein (c-di-GMP phosphodiesterase class II)
MPESKPPVKASKARAEMLSAGAIHRPIELPRELLGTLAPCDLFNARGVMLIKAGAPIPTLIHDPLWPVRLFCEAQHAQQLSNANPALQLQQVGKRISLLSARFLQGAHVSASEFSVLAQEVFDLWALDADACLGLARLSPHGQPSVWHALHVALLAAELGMAQGLDQDQIKNVIGSALTMNLSTLLLHDEMFNFSGTPSTAKRQEIRLHPLEGVRCLLQIGKFDPQWIEAVGAHHENIDGSGYPARLKGPRIPLSARIVRIADTLAARLTGRKMRPPRHWNMRHAHEITHLVQHIFGADLTRLDLPLTHRLMSVLSLFPPGSLVRLNNSELAVVTRRSPVSPTLPRQVLAVFDAYGEPYETPHPRQIGHSDYSIRSFALDTLHTLPRYDWHKAWGYGLA